MTRNPSRPIEPNAGIENYTLPSKQYIDRAGRGPLPSNMTGQNVDESPYVPARAGLVQEEFYSESLPDADLVYTEPEMPYSGSVNNSVWHSRHGGSFIEVAGKKDLPEFINIVHTNGTHITLDPNGNIIIKSFGDTHNTTTGNQFDFAEGQKTTIAKGGYVIHVKNGTMNVRSEGNMNFSTGGNLSFSAAGKLNMNIGDAIDIAGARIAMNSRVDTFDLASGTLMRISGGSELHLKTGGAFAMESEGGDITARAENIIASAAGSFSAKGGDAAILDGGSKASITASTVAIDDIVQMANGMADGAEEAGAAEPAIIAGVPEEPEKSIFAENTVNNVTGMNTSTGSEEGGGTLV